MAVAVATPAPQRAPSGLRPPRAPRRESRQWAPPSRCIERHAPVRPEGHLCSRLSVGPRRSRGLCLMDATAPSFSASILAFAVRGRWTAAFDAICRAAFPIWLSSLPLQRCRHPHRAPGELLREERADNVFRAENGRVNSCSR